ncbi:MULTISPECIES: glycerol-3-phosphate 1-O-acyltransferase PlsY [Legionella]|uniref:Glycerol-3-phosphate acyltransferase n=1 Tax=Legionella donaldsonii TaxID=45060 RepID=A0A378JAD4_9GAMM|nr:MULTISPECIES: glycerol-3-phosphate 1-O-acyltransferase PlsY [Legionella]MCC5013771.1 glycerol-3-phosphate 1-O-acyltransferase PlsY [Legionella sp. 31fI33]STX43921.1 transmembrane protein [Legionella donaldsonii]
MLSALLFIFVVVIAYLAGSVCSAVIVSRIFSLPDPRVTGSQNPGATNVLRLAGKKYALIVLIADMLKGLLPVVLAKALGAGPATISFTCFAAVMGHMYPVFFNFQGGKGVATAIGALLGFHFILGVMVIATWLLVANFSRYSSLASMASIALAPVYAIVTMSGMETLPPLLFIAMFILYKHRENITRLIDGEEPKIRFESHSLNEEITAALKEQVEEEKIERAEELEHKKELKHLQALDSEASTAAPKEKPKSPRKKVTKKPKA